MKKLNRSLALLMCLAMLTALPGVCALAQEPGAINEEEQWAVWETEENAAETGDAPSDAEANAEALTAEEEAMLSQLESAMNDVTPLDTVDLTNLSPNAALPDNVFNILLLGVDNRSTELERGRSDAVIICSINKDNGSIKLSSIARDTAVSILTSTGKHTTNRINVAYQRGGPELSMLTVNTNFQMNVERYVVVNIHGLAAIIDALGGVDMDMSAKEAARINFELRKEPMDNVKRAKVKAVEGLQHLDGMQAVTFARIRNLDNDLERTRRQRQLLETLLKKVLEGMDIMKFMSLVETALPYGQTNLTTDEMLSLGMLVITGDAMKGLQSGGEIMQQFRIPMDKKYGYKGFNGISLLYMNPKNLRFTIESLQEFIYGQSYYVEK